MPADYSETVAVLGHVCGKLISSAAWRVGALEMLIRVLRWLWCSTLCHAVVHFLGLNYLLNNKYISVILVGFVSAYYMAQNERGATLMTKVSRLAFGRAFCDTACGSIGWVPQEAESNDVFALFDGYSVPFVLRSREDREGNRLIGPAYVHGWMYGNLGDGHGGMEARDIWIV